MVAPRSSTRNTKFSPWMVGCAAARKSTVRPFMISDTRPSCGARDSAMFMPDTIFSRTDIGGQNFACRARICRSTPSIR